MKSRPNFKEIFNEIDDLIKSGGSALATKRLKAIKASSLQPSERSTYANLARRLHLPKLSLRLLHPHVHPKVKGTSTRVTDSEKIEYAGALVYVGAYAEALELLDGISGANQSDGILIRSFAYVAQWNYSEAIPLLRRFLELPEISEYQRLVCRVNLCDALVFERDDSAENFVDETLRISAEKNYTVAHGYLQLTRIYLEISTGNYEKAKRHLTEAEDSFKNADTREAFFVRKWRAILELRQNGVTRETRAAIEAIKKEAAERWLHWETVRDCDFHWAICAGDQELLLHLYHGTPHESFRKRLLAAAPELKPNSAFFALRIPYGSCAEKPFELLSGDSPLRRELVGSGKLLSRLVTQLVADFYRPARVSEIARALYPGEFYHPSSSSKRVMFSIQRLRRWLESNGIPLLIEEIQGDYRLSSKSSVALLLPTAPKVESKDDPMLELFCERFSLHPRFTVGEVATALGISSRSANRVLNEAESRGMISREGKGRATFYRWQGRSQQKDAA